MKWRRRDRPLARSYRALGLVLALVASCLAVIATSATPAEAAPTLVESASGGTYTSSTTVTAAFGTATTVGDLIVAEYTFDTQTYTSSSCTDSSGNSYSSPIFKNYVAYSQGVGICYAVVSSAGTPTVTITFGGSVGWRLLTIYEYSGVAASNPLDVSASNTGAAVASGANSVTSTAATTTANGDLVVGAFEDGDANSPTVTAGTGFTSRLSISNSGSNEFTTEDTVQSSAGSIAATETYSNTDHYDAVMAAFKPDVPNAPTSLAQYKSDGTTSIATSGWSNDSSGVVFKATVTDPGSAQVKLCVENTSGSFTSPASPGTCGSLVTSGSTASVSVTGLTTNTQYRWQVKAENSSGTYSTSYSQFNSGNLAYGYDVTNPTTGTVYDGSSAGSETTFNNGSLSSLSCNWSGFSDAGSGLASYDYSFGTTVGGTGILGWTNVTTSTTSITASSLTLRTSQRYYCNVRAHDNAGNVSTTVSSSGQLVEPTMTFTPSTNTITFASLGTGNSYTATQTLTLTTSTNAYNGYQIHVYEAGPLTSPNATISDYSSPASSPTSWSGTGFGYTITGGSAVSAFAGGTLYAHFGTSASPDTPVSNAGPVSGTPITNDTETVTVKVVASGTQAAGSYLSHLVWSVVPVY